MKKLLLLLIALSLICVSCASKVSDDLVTESIDKETTDKSISENVENETVKYKNDALPVLETVSKGTEINKNYNTKVDFKYIGEDKILETITKEMVEASKTLFDTNGIIEIPSPYVVAIDDSNKEDIKVYGDFLTYGYTLKGAVLYNINGGSMPGCYHLNADDEGNIIFLSKDIAEDGSNFDSSLNTICGGNHEIFDKITKKDDVVLETLRLVYVNMYANANGLKISGIKDYGWPIILSNSISDAEFLYNFYHSYFEEVLDENLLNDRDERVGNLIKKYAIESLCKKIDSETKEGKIGFVINTQDVTSPMIDSLQVDDYGEGNMKVRYASNKGEVIEINVKVENHDGRKVITDIYH